MRGVDQNITDPVLYAKNIKGNNLTHPIVNFTQRNGIPYDNYLIGREREIDSLFRDIGLPDGNDLIPK